MPCLKGRADRRTLGFLVSAAISITSARAQVPTLDPRTLQALQATLGVGGQTPNPAQQLDNARTAGATERRERDRTIEGLGNTAEEVAVRRERSQNELAGLSPLSPIEREYQQRLGDTTLRQFGYDLFRSAPSGAPLTGAISGDYTLGVGDELVVSFTGATPGSQTARVDREGRLIVGNLSPIRAAGRSLSSVRAELAAATHRTLLGTEVNLTIGQVRAISVFVGGEVGSPGEYQLTSLGDVAAALGQAGGIRRTGSLRHVRIVRGGATFEVDLYGLLGIGVPTGARLREGDRIIVPVLGPTVAISGGVARPAIYELRGPASVGQLLDYAGGAVRPRGSRVSISRIEADGSEVFVRGTRLATRLIAGDAVQVIAGSAGGAIGRVLLRGYVLNPGPRPLSATPTLRDLVGEVQDLRPDTYLPLAIVIRADPATGARRYVPVDLGAALNGSAPFALRGDDRVYVLAQSEANFINRVAVRTIVLGKDNPQPQCRPLDRLQQLVRDTQSQRYSVITRGSYTVTGSQVVSIANALSERTTLAATTRVLSARNTSAAGGAAAATRPADADVEDGTGNGTEARIGTVTGTGMGVGIRASDPNCPAVFNEEPDLLPVLIENAVSVGGSVRKPGAYPIAGPVQAATLAALAGGLLARPEVTGIDVTRASGASNSIERLTPRTDGHLPALVVRLGDDVRFSASEARFEPGAVLVTGEVARPGLFTIRRGEKLSELLARAGGVTSLAYPYGTIFTRQAVREQQQEGLRRTARELNEALLIALSHSSGSAAGGGDTIGQASQLVQAISSIDPIGRVVIEADPRVLARRPDLDIVLEAGDSLLVPKQPSFVLALGEIANPGAVQFIPGKTALEYISESGGLRRTSDVSHAFVVLPNGATEPLAASYGRRSRVAPPPGSTVIVPVNPNRFIGLSFARDIATIIGQFISSVATVALLAK